MIVNGYLFLQVSPVAVNLSSVYSASHPVIAGKDSSTPMTLNDKKVVESGLVHINRFLSKCELSPDIIFNKYNKGLTQNNILVLVCGNIGLKFVFFIY